MSTHRIPEQNIFDLKATINKLAKRAAKLGSEPVTLTVLSTEDVPEFKEGVLTGNVKRYYNVEVTGTAPVLAGWSFTAVIELDHEAPEAPNVVHVLDGEADPTWRNLDERCDHCNVSNRRRNKLVVVTHTDGTRKIVGTTCLADFLGHADPHAAANWAEMVADLDFSAYEDDEFDYSGPRPEERFDAAWYLGWCVRSIETSGWVPRSATRFGGSSTADDALHLARLNSGQERPERNEEIPADLDAREIAKGAQAAEWAKDQGGNDYLDNLAAIALKPTLRRKDLGLAASIISAYDRYLGRLVEREAQAKATAASTHVGTVGERIELTGTVTFVRFFDGDYGTRALVKILSDGNVLTWWCSNASNAPEIGDIVTGKATIKAHEEFNGTPQTVITRAKLALTGRVEVAA